MSVRAYDEYGVMAVSLFGFGYTGQPAVLDAGPSVYHYRARFYHAPLGRFLQTDPIGYAGGMNLYAYVGNDPVNWTDPFGLQQDDADGQEIFVTALRWIIQGGFGGGARGTRAAWAPGGPFEDNPVPCADPICSGVVVTGPRRRRPGSLGFIAVPGAALQQVICSIPPIGVAGGAEGYSGAGGGLYGGVSFDPATGRLSLFWSKYVGAGSGAGAYGMLVVNAPTGVSANVVSNVSVGAFGVGASYSRNLAGSQQGQNSLGALRVGPQVSASASAGALVSLPITPTLYDAGCD